MMFLPNQRFKKDTFKKNGKKAMKKLQKNGLLRALPERCHGHHGHHGHHGLGRSFWCFLDGGCLQVTIEISRECLDAMQRYRSIGPYSNRWFFHALNWNFLYPRSNLKAYTHILYTHTCLLLLHFDFVDSYTVSINK